MREICLPVCKENTAASRDTTGRMGGKRQRDQEVNFKEPRATKMKPELLSGPIPPGHIPKPIVMPDYVA